MAHFSRPKMAHFEKTVDISRSLSVLTDFRDVYSCARIITEVIDSLNSSARDFLFNSEEIMREKT